MTQPPSRPTRALAAADLPYPAHFEAYQHRQISERLVHEPDFLLLRRLPREGLLVLDAGANIGNSAISCEIVAPGCRIIGFEPNPSLRPFLERARDFCGNMEWHPFGLAEAAGMRQLHIPVVGGRHIAGESSMLLSHFDDPVVSARLTSYSAARSFTLESCALEFHPLDALAEIRAECRRARIILIKIDVEGAELEVLRGAREVLAEHHPILLIEQGDREEIAGHLAGLGYARYLRSGRNRLFPAGDRRALNSFFLTPAAHAALGLGQEEATA